MFTPFFFTILKSHLFKTLQTGISPADISASLAPPPLDENLSVGERMKCIQACVTRSTSGADGVTVAYDYIKVYKTLVLACGLSIRGVFEDPKVRNTANAIYVSNNSLLMILYER